MPNSALQNNVVDQPAGLDSVDVAAGRLVDEISGPVCKNLKIEEGQAVTTFYSPNPHGQGLIAWILGLEGCLRPLCYQPMGNEVMNQFWRKGSVRFLVVGKLNV